VSFFLKLINEQRTTKKDIDALDKVIEHMKDTLADACSGIWQDEKRKTLLAAFAHQVPIEGWQ